MSTTSHNFTPAGPAFPPTSPPCRTTFGSRGGPTGCRWRRPPRMLVRAMLTGCDGEPSHSLGVMQPRNARATLEKLAINAVMAGCRPEHFPVVVAAVKAALHDEFNLAGNAATTGGASQVVIVNGPVAAELGIQADAGCFGPGFRANAAIGRALRLIIRNVAGLTPGEMDKATLSSPGRFSFCFAENEARSPWEPLHVEKGYAPESSTVTLAGILGIYRVMESTSGTGFGVLRTIVGNMKAVGIANYYQQATGGQVILALCPRARRRGCRFRPVQSRREGVRFPQRPDAGADVAGPWPTTATAPGRRGLTSPTPARWSPSSAPPATLPCWWRGGDGRHSAWMAGWGVTRMSTEEIGRTPLP